MDTKDNDLIELIYTAGLVPEVWPDVIDRMARRMNAGGGSIFSLSEGHLSWEAPAGTRSIMDAYIAGGWADRNPRLEGLLQRAHPGFVQDSDVAQGCYDRLPIVTDFLRPNGIFYTAATVISGARDDLAVFSVDRGQAAGPYRREEIRWLDALRPHLGRSVALASRLRLRQASSATTALAMVGIPAAILRRRHGVVATNGLFDALVGSVFVCGAFGSLALRDRRADQVLRDALAVDHSSRPVVRSIPIAGEEGAVGVLHVIPACRQASDVLGADGTLLVVAQPRTNVTASADCLRWLYDLTPTEASIASRLSAGSSIAEIAAATATTSNTVRTHVKGILRKTGFSRQRDLLMAIGSLAALDPRLL
ncbi:LuxR C-terminal-related transcriptional regulator [Aurantimonas sp. Leaf443]|uniref:helix-turn-helix transcriptional regulator n=1 Tax=Aurantimonas sp. Leaf443 TaxID=1736378 RepID=UPI0006F7308A|nr:LuxR C-terminal-related transcriptional regulator [Aurantimonas sp. Leaf443]KQT85902.1 hypothetical protein ASG48_04655 [Aurantimonas sp. Leaf443]